MNEEIDTEGIILNIINYSLYNYRKQRDIRLF